MREIISAILQAIYHGMMYKHTIIYTHAEVIVMLPPGQKGPREITPSPDVEDFRYGV